MRVPDIQIVSFKFICSISFELNNRWAGVIFFYFKLQLIFNKFLNMLQAHLLINLFC